MVVPVRVVIEVFGRAFILQYGKLDDESPAEEQEFQDAPPQDPHGTSSCQVEHGPGTDSYVDDIMSARKFGFSHGR